MSKQLIITGMHRSGTSFVTSVLQQAGVHVGKNLLGAYKGNQHGHFEDFDFLYFHENVLLRFGESPFTQPQLTPGQFTTSERDLALSLIEQRQTYSLWGWKDPRTALMLEFWHNLLPNARYIFIYRHPLEVTLSLVRRGTDIEALAAPQIGLQAWQTYNRALLDFYQQHPENCILANVHGLVADIDSFVNLAVEKFGLLLHSEKPEALFHSSAFHKLDLAYTPEIMALLDQISPDVTRLYYELDQLADVPDLFSRQGEQQARPPQTTLDKVAKLRDYIGLQQLNAHSVIYELLALLDPDAISAIASRAKELSQDYSRVKTNYMNLLIQTGTTATN